MQKATIDRHGVAWIATYRKLFRVEHGRPQLVESTRSDERLLSVAPGGERYAWLDSRKAPYGQFAIELFDLNRPGTMIAELDIRRIFPADSALCASVSTDKRSLG